MPQNPLLMPGLLGSEAQGLSALTNPLAPPDYNAQLGPPDPRLSHVETGPRANYMAEADANMTLTPQEKYLYNTHLTNLWGNGKIVHPNGSISSLLQMSFGQDGRFYNIPTVWGGQQLAPGDAINAARRVGLDNYPSYSSEDEAEARYDAMHQYLEKDTADFIARSRQL